MVSCLGQRKDDSMVFICANWSMTCCLTEEHLETVLGLVAEGCIMVSDCKLTLDVRLTQDISLVCTCISSLPLDFVMSDLSCLYKYKLEIFHIIHV